MIPRPQLWVFRLTGCPVRTWARRERGVNLSLAVVVVGLCSHSRI